MPPPLQTHLFLQSKLHLTTSQQPNQREIEQVLHNGLTVIALPLIIPLPLNFFSSNKLIKPNFVSLPNGQVATATNSGTI
jgi:hypothetical protein